MPRKIITAGLLGLLYSQLALSHGEDQLGPNGGFVRMPGAFHTEVVPRKRNFQVFLLDVEFKNPMVAESNVEFTLKQADRETKDNCEPVKNHFVCSLPKDVALQTGNLEVKASRNNVVGGIVNYKLPLKLAKHQ